MLLLVTQVGKTGSEKGDWVQPREAAHPSSAGSAGIRYQQETRVKSLAAAVHPITDAIKETGARTKFTGSVLNMMKLNCLYFN